MCERVLSCSRVHFPLRMDMAVNDNDQLRTPAGFRWIMLLDSCGVLRELCNLRMRRKDRKTQRGYFAYKYCWKVKAPHLIQFDKVLQQLGRQHPKGQYIELKEQINTSRVLLEQGHFILWTIVYFVFIQFLKWEVRNKERKVVILPAASQNNHDLTTDSFFFFNTTAQLLNTT